MFPLFQDIRYRDYTEVNLNYEYIIKKLNLGVYIPFDYNFGYNSVFGGDSLYGGFKKYGSGIGFRLYSNNQFNHSFYIGAAILLDKINTFKEVDYNNGYPIFSYSHTTQDTQYLQFGCQNFINKRIYLAFNLNAGFIHVTNFSRGNRTLINAELKLGYRIK